MATPDAPRQRFPSWKQVLVMLGGGTVLAATACLGFLVTFGGSFNRGGNALTAVAAILFCVGVLAFLIGVILLIVRAVRAMLAANDPGRPAS